MVGSAFADRRIHRRVSTRTTAGDGSTRKAPVMRILVQQTGGYSFVNSGMVPPLQQFTNSEPWVAAAVLW
jgi:hypothetical protein